MRSFTTTPSGDPCDVKLAQARGDGPQRGASGVIGRIEVRMQGKLSDVGGRKTAALQGGGDVAAGVVEGAGRHAVVGALVVPSHHHGRPAGERRCGARHRRETQNEPERREAAGPHVYL
jgi:hypothetical protein